MPQLKTCDPTDLVLSSSHSSGASSSVIRFLSGPDHYASQKIRRLDDSMQLVG